MWSQGPPWSQEAQVAGDARSCRGLYLARYVRFRWSCNIARVAGTVAVQQDRPWGRWYGVDKGALLGMPSGMGGHVMAC
jgi:hypothetical protein